MLKQNISADDASGQAASLREPKTPPGPHGYPIIGNLPQMLRNPLQFLSNAVRQYGDVVHLGAMGSQQLYLVAHPDHLKYILQENSRNYIKGQNFQAIKLVIGDGLAVKEGESWRRERHLMQPTFHRQKVSTLVNLMTKNIAQMLENWRNIGLDKPLDIFAEMMQLAQTILLESLLSIDSNDEIDPLNQAWDTAYEYLSSQLWAVIKLPLWVPTPKNRRFQQSMQTLNAAIYRIIRERREGSKSPHDLLSMLMDAYDQESGQGMSDKQLRDEIMTIFTGGFETSAAVLAWTWYLLSQNPSVEYQLQEEISRVLDGRTPTLEDLPSLKYTRMIIEESMRLYPGAWVFTRTNLESDQIGDYHIPARSLIMVSPYVTQRLPTFWENPEEFNPERFTREQVAQRPRYAYFPFGGGPRQCIGEIFAMTEMQLVVAMIAQKYRLHSVPGHPVEEEPMFTLRPRHGILMTLESQVSLVDAC
ncbi:cytochrome P450 [Nostoc sp. FACHB-892]|uniref:cytochrome P450 n=1 Tax=Nostoc sp. FACHB-892 TaxID=2692843 RepID=UPI001684E747|nr:cytochrome P450 [Nostoc sp. FACHB-892]MBD2726588.1 cytochrome P450 [Nostoc sp. FACHB-892]